MEGDIHSEVSKGIIPRTVEALFDGVRDADENIEFMFKVSYVEIYLEKIRCCNILNSDLHMRLSMYVFVSISMSMYLCLCMYVLPVVPVYAYVFLNVRIGIGRDLLDENHVKNNLTVREDKIKGIYIAGVTEEYVTSVEELLGIMSVGRSGLSIHFSVAY